MEFDPARSWYETVLNMKHQKKNKAKTRSKSTAHAKTTTKAHSQQRTPSPTRIETDSPNLTLNPSLKSCQEVEVGDIGGFGSTKELEEHQKRCSEPATEFCGNCGRSLCRNHYDLLHRDHDGLTGHPTGASLA